MRLLATLTGVAVLAVLLDTAYRHNWIPPVPLAVQAGGIYENVRREGDDFVATWQRRDWGLFARDYAHELYVAEGDTVFAFSAVFAPTGLREKIYHVWQHRRGDEWVATDRIGYSVLGGRDGGYRGIAFKRQLAHGRWRVLVETSDGRILTRIPFEVVRGAAPSERPEPTASLRERRF